VIREAPEEKNFAQNKLPRRKDASEKKGRVSGKNNCWVEGGVKGARGEGQANARSVQEYEKDTECSTRQRRKSRIGPRGVAGKRNHVDPEKKIVKKD